MYPGTSSLLTLSLQILICLYFAFMLCFANDCLGLCLINILYNCLYIVVISYNLEKIICYILFSIMAIETEVVVSGSSIAHAGAIDWTTYSFPQPR